MKKSLLYISVILAFAFQSCKSKSSSNALKESFEEVGANPRMLYLVAKDNSKPFSTAGIEGTVYLVECLDLKGPAEYKRCNHLMDSKLVKSTSLDFRLVYLTHLARYFKIEGKPISSDELAKLKTEIPKIEQDISGLELGALSDGGGNIDSQLKQARDDLGRLVADVERSEKNAPKQKIMDSVTDLLNPSASNNINVSDPKSCALLYPFAHNDQFDLKSNHEFSAQYAAHCPQSGIGSKQADGPYGNLKPAESEKVGDPSDAARDEEAFRKLKPIGPVSVAPYSSPVQPDNKPIKPYSSPVQVTKAIRYDYTVRIKPTDNDLIETLRRIHISLSIYNELKVRCTDENPRTLLCSTMTYISPATIKYLSEDIDRVTVRETQ